MVRDQDGRAKLYADIAHPINSECREMIQKHVIQEFQAEIERAQQPDYVSHYDDGYDDLYDEVVVDVPAEQAEPTNRPTGERSHIQPAEAQPRPPHRPPSQTQSKPTEQRRNDQFGAGIFE